jgi:hypothetical protein
MVSTESLVRLKIRDERRDPVDASDIHVGRLLAVDNDRIRHRISFVDHFHSRRHERSLLRGDEVGVEPVNDDALGRNRLCRNRHRTVVREAERNS